MSSCDENLSWGNVTEEELKNSMGKMATNDVAESIFGGLAQITQMANRTGMGSAAAVTQVRRNKDLSRGCNDNEKMDISGDQLSPFHQLPEQM